MKARIQKFIKYMAGPYPVFWILPYFMVLVILGTIEQKYMGLYDAVQTYIYDPIIWYYFIPLPGGGIILTLLFLSLLLNFLTSHKWKIEKSGILLTHFGMLLLLLGGAITFITKDEGFILFEEGETSDIFYDYHQRILKISKNNEEFIVSHDELKAGQIIKPPFSNISFQVISSCENCDVLPMDTRDKTRKGLAKDVTLKSIPSKLNKEENFSGITFNVFNDNNESIGVYIALEDLKKFPIISDIQVKLQRGETRLPFSLALNDFRKIDYAGSNQAQAYESDVLISDGVSNWPYTIKMNEPLRYGGYTFYQSSFDQIGGAEISVLNVVKDNGRLFPYISSLLIALGLILHCWIKFYCRKEER